LPWSTDLFPQVMYDSPVPAKRTDARNVSLWLPCASIERLDALAASLAVSRAEVVVRLIARARLPGEDAPSVPEVPAERGRPSLVDPRFKR